VVGDIGKLLERLGLGEHVAVFAQNKIDAAALALLSDIDLKELGIVALGDRRKLQAAIAELASSDEPGKPTASSAERPASAQPERRQLTVMFCDMAGSTALSTQLDPEDYREIVRAYQDACAGVISRCGGYIGQFLGDGVLAYFGYPQAHEDDARQAIGAGLGIIAAVADIAMPEGEKPLEVRIGIATGPVVVGDIIGEGSAQEVAVSGETPNLAARLQALAKPNTIVVAPSTHALAGGLFDYEALGPQTMKGIDGTPEVWRVIGERWVESRFAAAHGRELTPLIGREEELELLARRWQRARDGEGQVVLFAGEPGIGKSRLVRALRDKIADEPHTRLIYQCSPHHTSSALYPIISQLERAADIGPGEGTDARLDKLEKLLEKAGRPTENVMPLIASLLSIPGGERYPLPDLTPQQLKDRTLTALVDQLVGFAEQQSVLFVFEDAHWIDPTSLELMSLITRRIPDLPVLMVITYRPEFAAPWVGLPDVATLNLSRLNARACTAMAEQLAGAASLPTEVIAQLVAKTDGVPLFVEELTRSIIDARARSRSDKRDVPAEQDTAIVIPATLQEALDARLDRSPQIREVAQVGAAIGREFSYDLMARVASLPSAELDAALDDLVGSGLIFARGTPPDATYIFKHALVQDTAYDSMMRSKRRETHKRISEALLRLQPDVGDTEPAVLAHHYTEAGMLEEAIDWWLRAGKAASARSANPEAVKLLERGLSLIAKLPGSEARDRRELALQTSLFGPLISVKGQASAEFEIAFDRTLELCKRIDAPQEKLRALFAKSLSHTLRGQHLRSHEVAEELLQQAKHASDEGALLVGHRMVGMSLFLLGRVIDAQKYFDAVKSTFDRQRHGHLMLTYGQDPALTSAMYSVATQWVLGWPDKARITAENAIAEAVVLGHASTLGSVLASVSYFQSVYGDVDGSRRTVGHLATLLTQHKMPFYETIWRAAKSWVEGATHPTRQTAEQLQDALVHSESLSRNAPSRPIRWGSQLAQNYLAIGDVTKALEANKKGFDHADESGEHWSDSELFRVRGLALAMRDGVNGNDEAETCLRRAIDDARSRSAKSLELRAAMSLARFLRDQGRADEARQMLAPVYDWFTEGFGTPDLMDAKALLDELS
jgi:class 3 adenylate cyclase/tetratricopeptide (TPR) repeat protein